MAENQIHIFIMGGTIDSHWDGTKDTVVPNTTSVLPKYIQGLKLSHKIKLSEICMKDSRDVTTNDLKKLINGIERSAAEKVIITHGTYTMADTARYIKANLARKDQVIVLTGSFVPLEGFTFSDAPFNLGFSFANLDKLDPGVYVCMNGKVLRADETMKYLKEGRFLTIFEENKTVK